MTGDPTKILFVCMGNICRSPTAEAVLRHLVAERGLEERFHIDSAGTHAFNEGSSPDPRSCAAARRRGYAMGDHRSRRIADEDFVLFDKILVMDRENLAYLHFDCPPEARDKIEPLMRYAAAGEDAEVPDPYSGQAGFDHVLDLIEEATRGLLDHLTRRRVR